MDNETSKKFWVDDVSILFSKKTYLHFWPTVDMTYTEKLNAISRFFIYSFTLAFFIKGNTINIALLGISLLIVFALSKRKVHDTALSKKLLDPHEEYISEKQDTGERTVKKLENLSMALTGTNTCKGPTDDNPFMNVLPTDYVDEDGNAKNKFLPSCKYDEVDENVSESFEKGLFKDVNDVYNRENSQRQFYTVANNKVPNSQKEFASWLYSKDSVCKAGDLKECTGYE